MGTLSAMRGPSFPGMRESLGPYLVDKTALIEKIVITGFHQRVDLVLRPRRCGKSCMLHMLKSFFSNQEPDQQTLFEGLYIASRSDICKQHMGKYAVIFLDFMTLRAETWDVMLLLFRSQLSSLYDEWEEYLRGSLSQQEMIDYHSIIRNEASFDLCKLALRQLSYLLARKSRRGVVVLMDEYEGPVSCAAEYGFYAPANEYFGCGVFSALLKGNDNLSIGILVGVTPSAKSGWYSGLNNVVMHPLHRLNSVYAGRLMFTEEEVQRLMVLSESTLELEDLRSHYHSYLAANQISVYNPVSIMSALEQGIIRNFWVATGEHPLIQRPVESLDPGMLEVFTTLLTLSEVDMDLAEDVYLNVPDLNNRGIITLLYYAGYLTMTASGKLKIPNAEVLSDWSTWITGRDLKLHNIFMTCVNGPTTLFTEQWPLFMQATLHPKLVAKECGAKSKKTPERLYHLYILGALQSLRPCGWELESESCTGLGNFDIRLRKKRDAVMIELKASQSEQQLERDADAALDQIITKNHRNRYSHLGVDCIREYGIACFQLQSVVKARYMVRSGNGWLETDDPSLTY